VDTPAAAITDKSHHPSMPIKWHGRLARGLRYAAGIGWYSSQEFPALKISPLVAAFFRGRGFQPLQIPPLSPTKPKDSSNRAGLQVVLRVFVVKNSPREIICFYPPKIEFPPYGQLLQFAFPPIDE
jgi:hypothetical protein